MPLYCWNRNSVFGRIELMTRLKTSCMLVQHYMPWYIAASHYHWCQYSCKWRIVKYWEIKTQFKTFLNKRPFHKHEEIFKRKIIMSIVSIHWKIVNVIFQNSSFFIISPIYYNQSWKYTLNIMVYLNENAPLFTVINKLEYDFLFWWNHEKMKEQHLKY